jgi:PAS domain S-box-containing protein
VIVTYSDTSERHAAERALRKSEAMYRNLVETSNDLIWSVDAEGRWTYLSPARVRRIYGCQPATCSGRELRDMRCRRPAERDMAVFARILAGESVFDYLTRHQRRDGSHVDLSFNAVPLRDTRGDGDRRYRHRARRHRGESRRRRAVRKRREAAPGGGRGRAHVLGVGARHRPAALGPRSSTLVGAADGRNTQLVRVPGNRPSG